MSRGAFHNRRRLRHACALRTGRRSVILGMQRNDRSTRAVGSHEPGRHARQVLLDLEAGFFQQTHHQFRCLELLHAELGEIKNIIAQRCDRLAVMLDGVECELLLLAMTHECKLRSLAGWSKGVLE